MAGDPDANYGQLVINWLEHQNQTDFQSMDLHLARFVMSEMPKSNIKRNNVTSIRQQCNLFVYLSALVSRNVLRQHTCVSLQDAFQYYVATAQDSFELPDLSQWHSILRASDLVDVRDLPSDTDALNQNEPNTNGFSPFALYDDLFYMQRYFHYEYNLARYVADKLLIAAKGAKDSGGKQKYWFQTLEQQLIKDTVLPLFDRTGLKDNEVNWQQEAVLNSVNAGFFVISGGPGTGKTTTVIKLLLTLQRLKQIAEPGGKRLDIRLVAPTGKASQRLSESIANSKTKLSISEEEQRGIPEQALTIHRLLKPKGFNEFFHNEHNRLNLDVLILDEASMVDISLMNRLINALPQQAQLILLGDQQQLASVEAGNVMADLCAAQFKLNELDKKTFGESKRLFQTELLKSYRFSEQSEIGQLAQSIKNGDAQQALAQTIGYSVETTSDQPLHDNQLQAINWYQPKLQQLPLLIESAVAHYIKIYQAIQQSRDVTERLLNDLFDILAEFQLLACVKQSQWGVDELNNQIQYRLSRRVKSSFNAMHYVGRPIMITENAYHLGLYNGDIGIELFDSQSQQIMAYFKANDSGVMSNHSLGAYKGFACQRLPAHQTSYAMTVHKSQGSEFNHVALVLPESNNLSANVTRELIYTGLTRAKTHFSLFGSDFALRRSIQQHTARHSGLASMITKLTSGFLHKHNHV